MTLMMVDIASVVVVEFPLQVLEKYEVIFFHFIFYIRVSPSFTLCVYFDGIFIKNFSC